MSICIKTGSKNVSTHRQNHSQGQDLAKARIRTYVKPQLVMLNDQDLEGKPTAQTKEGMIVVRGGIARGGVFTPGYIAGTGMS